MIAHFIFEMSDIFCFCTIRPNTNGNTGKVQQHLQFEPIAIHRFEFRVNE